MTKQYPPTIFVRAMEDTTLQPEQTSHAYDRLEALGVECKMISVPGMQHGDVELIQPGRRERWEVWFKDVCSVALEWCMEKCGEPKSLKVNGVVHGVVKAGIPGLLGEVTAGLVDGTVA